MAEVNFFEPYGPDAKHEDRLTWAFLVLLQYDLPLQNFLRGLVKSRLPSSFQEPQDYNNWEPATIATQTQWIDSSTTPLVSVLITDKCTTKVKEIEVRWSCREPRYDGVIEYPNRMTLIIENKLKHDDVWQNVGQLSPSKNWLSGDIDLEGGTALHGSVICLEWSELLEGVLKYANSRMASGDSRKIALDFLVFVETNHPELTPYRTFDLCGYRREALKRRLVRLSNDIATRLKEMTSREFEVKREELPGFIGDRVICRPNKEPIAQRVRIDIPSPEGGPWKLRLAMWPASTAAQADRFRERVETQQVQLPRFLESLKEAEWTVEPNLNFSFMGTKLLWARRDCGIEKYLEHFFNNPPHRPYGQKQKQELQETLIPEWLEREIIGPDDPAQIQRECRNREHLDVNPEFSVYREWDRDTVIQLEQEGRLKESIIDAIPTALAKWGEEI